MALPMGHDGRGKRAIDVWFGKDIRWFRACDWLDCRHTWGRRDALEGCCSKLSEITDDLI